MPWHEGVGWKGTDTSLHAARAIQPRAGTLQEAVLNVLRAAPAPMTTEEIARSCAVDYRSIQPRISELRSMGLVRDSGIRRPSIFNRPIAAWEPSPQGEDHGFS